MTDDHDPASEPTLLKNDYASRTTWAEILEPHGWVCRRSDDSHGEVWEPPGRNTSATGHTAGAAYARRRDGLYVLSTSTVFPAKVTHSKFWAYTILNHAGDMRAAIDALHGQGIGIRCERDKDGNQLVMCGKYTYTWPADREPLAVGDIVLLPPLMSDYMREVFGDQPWEGVVTELGAAYAGRLAQVMKLARRPQG